MCGICGIYNKGASPISEEHIIQMRDIMFERGPEDAGVHIGEHIGLGHRRLKIIDLSESARQPMSSEDGQTWMVYNGEIYNYVELRECLMKAGHFFKSQSDGETIIHGFEEWGLQVFDKLKGMFAIAIWDAQKETLVLCRDRIGKKPLFYTEVNGSVVFASDIKAILKSSYVCDLEIDEKGLDCYLYHICVPQAHTIFKGLQKVQPASYVMFEKHRTTSVKYWNLSFRTKTRLREEQYVAELDVLLRTAIKDRLVSDVPVGAFLSGGVDSSIVVALMSQLTDHKVQTFSMGFDYQEFNELPYARQIADKYDTDHHESMMTGDYVNILPKLVWHYGEPFADSSAVPSYYISKMAHEKVKVVLCGDGGDEGFAGYSRTDVVNRALFYRRLVPMSVSRNVLYPFFGIAGKYTDKFHVLNRIRYYDDYTNDTVRSRYKNMMGNIHDREQYYSDQFKETLGAHHPAHVYEEFYDRADAVDEIDRVLSVDYHTILPDDYQVKMDVASMSNSLEVRAPFLDYRIVEFASQIPSSQKLKIRCTKYLLKKLAEKYVPEKNIYRPKTGFAMPIGAWFRKELRPYLFKVILGEKAKKRAYFNYDHIQYIVNEHLAGRGYHEQKLWSLLWLEIWHRMFVDKDITQDNLLTDLL